MTANVELPKPPDAVRAAVEAVRPGRQGQDAAGVYLLAQVYGWDPVRSLYADVSGATWYRWLRTLGDAGLPVPLQDYKDRQGRNGAIEPSLRGLMGLIGRAFKVYDPPPDSEQAADVVVDEVTFTEGRWWIVVADAEERTTGCYAREQWTLPEFLKACQLTPKACA